MDKSAKYRAKDIEGYRRRKAAFARTPEQRAIRTAYMRKWREANREKFNKQARESHERNKHKHVGKHRAWRLKTIYGISEEEYLSMVEKQGGACFICKRPEPNGKKLHIDHCHKTTLLC